MRARLATAAAAVATATGSALRVAASNPFRLWTGVAAVAGGAWMVYEPAGLIVVGGFLVADAVVDR